MNANLTVPAKQIPPIIKEKTALKYSHRKKKSLNKCLSFHNKKTLKLGNPYLKSLPKSKPLKKIVHRHFKKKLMEISKKKPYTTSHKRKKSD